jgi:dolichyldiphosphatase
MFGGQMACEAINFILKRVLKEERPARMQNKGYGMPSSHAQFVSFFSLTLALFLVFRHTPKPRTEEHTPLSLASRVGLSGLAVGGAGVVAWSRVYLGYHTPKQVWVGCLAGAVCAVGWFAFTAVLRQYGVLSWILDLPVVRLFRLRDLVVNEDLVQAGWETWEEQRRNLDTGNKKKR